MKDIILKIAGVKTEKQLYKLFPDEASFMKKHGEEFKKAQNGMPLKEPPMMQTYPAEDLSLYPLDYSQSVLRTWGPIGRMKSTAPTAIDAMVHKDISVPNYLPKQPKIGMETALGAIPVVGGIAQGISKLKAEREALKEARQSVALTDVQSKAAASGNKNLPQRKYVRPEDLTMTGEEMFPIYGVTAKNGAEIQTEKMQLGGILGNPQFSGMLNNAATWASGGDSAGATIGGAFGDAVGLIPGIGPIAGALAKPVLSAIGNFIDTNPEKTKKARQLAERNVMKTMGMNIPGMFSANMENGGWMNPEYNPQIIAKIGDVPMQELAKYSKEGMETLRAGGHLKEYMPPSLSSLRTMESGGNLQTLWGGYAENVDGETLLFKGNAHSESDGKGRTGIGVKYGNSNVEVEDGETFKEMNNGGIIPEKTGVVFGNLKISSSNAKLMGEESFKNMKFKNAQLKISKENERAQSVADKSANAINDLSVITTFDKIALDSFSANMRGANMKKANNDQKTQKLADLQNALNEYAEENSLDADALAKGKLKKAKNGTFMKAQDGKEMYLIDGKPFTKEQAITTLGNEKMLSTGLKYGFLTIDGKKHYVSTRAKIANQYPAFTQPTKSLQQIGDDLTLAYTAYHPQTTTPTQVKKSSSPTIEQPSGIYELSPWKGNVSTGDKYGKKTASTFTEEQWNQIAKNLGFTGKGNKAFQEFLINNPKTKDIIKRRHQELYGKEPFLDDKLGYGYSAPELLNLTSTPVADSSTTAEKPIIETKQAEQTKKEEYTPIKTQKEEFPWVEAINSVYPYFRPTDQQSLNPMQLLGEMYAMSDKPEPVYSQTYNPLLRTPYDISYQDKINEMTAQERASSRLLGYNPAATANLAAQTYGAKSNVLAEQFRANQAMKEGIYAQNRQTLNEAALKNLELRDEQYNRQQQAISNTKQNIANALSSIGAKYMQNRLENRTLGTYENLYNYRFNDDFRAQNWNPFATFNTQVQGAAPTGVIQEDGKTYRPIAYDKSGQPTKFELVSSDGKKKNGAKIKARNGNLIKAFKNL